MNKIYDYYKEQIESESNAMFTPVSSGFHLFLRDYIREENKNIVMVVPNNALAEQVERDGIKAIVFHRLHKNYMGTLNNIKNGDVVIFHEMGNLPKHWYHLLHKVYGKLSLWGVKYKVTYPDNGPLELFLRDGKPIELRKLDIM